MCSLPIVLSCRMKEYQNTNIKHQCRDKNIELNIPSTICRGIAQTREFRRNPVYKEL